VPISDAAFTNALTGMAEALPDASAVLQTAMTAITASLNFFTWVLPSSTPTIPA
jgi:hypothetical protein